MPRQPFSAPRPRALPTSTPTQDINQTLANWQTQLQPIVQNAAPQATPQNFSVTNSRGGLNLSWSPVAGADGYEILKSSNGSFTDDLQTIPVKSAGQTSYSDSLGGNSKTAAYRIRTTSGTASNPQSQRGPESGVVQHTSIDSSDTKSLPTTKFDTFTTDKTRSASRTGNYGAIKASPLGKTGGALAGSGAAGQGGPGTIGGGTGIPALPSAGDTTFDVIGTGENVSAAMTVGQGAQIAPDPVNPGIIEANYIQGAAVTTAAPSDMNLLQYVAANTQLQYVGTSGTGLVVLSTSPQLFGIVAVNGMIAAQSSIVSTNGVLELLQNDAYIELMDFNFPYFIQAGPRGAQYNLSATAITGNVLTGTFAPNTVPTAGQQLQIFGTAEPFLQNAIVTVLAGATATQFTAVSTHANYSNPADTGYAVSPGLTATVVMNLPNVAASSTVQQSGYILGMSTAAYLAAIGHGVFASGDGAMADSGILFNQQIGFPSPSAGTRFVEWLTGPLSIALTAAAASTNRIATLPDATGTLAMLNSTFSPLITSAIEPPSDSTKAIVITNAAATTQLAQLDTTNIYIGVGNMANATNMGVAGRPLCLVDSRATMNVTRIGASIATGAPSYEWGHSTTQNGALDFYWDFYGTIGAGVESIVLRRRTVTDVTIAKFDQNGLLTMNAIAVTTVTATTIAGPNISAPTVVGVETINTMTSPLTGAVINSSTVTALTPTGITTNGLFLVRDQTSGGSALVYMGDGPTFNIIYTSGLTAFVTGAAAATQIQLSYVGSPTYSLCALAGASRNGDTVRCLALLM